MRLILCTLLLLAPLPLAAQLRGYPMSRDSIAGRIADLQRIHTPEGIDTLEAVEVNGSTQWISIRGLNRANPILLVVHGGPASPLMGMTWAYQKPWEDFFTVVNWDQRGIGKNFSAADTARLAPTMTEDQHLQDAAAVVRHVLSRLGRQKLVMMGYSWGTKFTPAVVARHPEWFHAWVGLGVVGTAANAEAALYNRVVELATRARDTVAMRELAALAPYPGPGPFDMGRALAVRGWVRRYDGGWYGKPDFALYEALPEWGPTYSTEDVAAVGPASAWAGPLISRSFVGHETLRFPVPVVFLMGRYDLHTPYAAARAYFDRIEAPRKTFVTFERSAHMIMFEEPGRFLQALLTQVLPLAGGAVPFTAQPDPAPRPRP